MSKLAKSLTAAAGNAGKSAPNVEDVFSTYLHEGNGSSQTITNGIDLAGKGGMVWLKGRNINAGYHRLFDTERGATKYLDSASTVAESTDPSSLTALNSDGFSLSSAMNVNRSGGYNYASWTFRKAPRFFDVVTYTGTGVAGLTVSHSLGSVVGTIIVKNTSSATNWMVLHRNDGSSYKNLHLDTTNADIGYLPNYWGDGTSFYQPTSTEFKVGTGSNVNASGDTYVAYLFAHDPVGENDDGMIACGSYTGAYPTQISVELGWEPQYVLVRPSTQSSNWDIIDNMRGAVVGGDDAFINADTSNAEGSNARIRFTPTGFETEGGGTSTNANGATHIYMAIRRGPMKLPESGTDVLAIDTRSGSGSVAKTNSDILTDATIIMRRDSATEYNLAGTRLQGPLNLQTQSDTAVVQGAIDGWDSMTGITVTGSNGAVNTGSLIDYSLRRFPQVFDVVAYTGDGVAGRTVDHNLGVVPEMMWVKGRDSALPWTIYTESLGTTGWLYLHDINYAQYSAGVWGSTNPTDSNFILGSTSLNNVNGENYITYLFATLDGISKVGSYTGNGSNQDIACGFSAGARFVLIKRTDSNGDWYLWDTTRGIVAGNDPHLSLNTTSAEVTTDDSIDPHSAGFTVNQVSATNINVSSATYIFLAIA